MSLPPPLKVGQALVDGFLDVNNPFSYPVAIGASMLRLLIGYALAVAIGLPLGLATARSVLIRDTLGSWVVGLQTLPSIVWLPLAIIWFGLTEKAIIFVVVMGATFAIATSVDDSIRNVSPLLLKAGRTLGAEGMRLNLRVTLPAALPTIVTGLKLGWSFAWRSLMAAELMYGAVGVGRVLDTGRANGDSDIVIATILVILMLGLVVSKYVFGPIETALAHRWGLVVE